MNSSMEDVLSCRCAGLHNQNMELHVYNTGNQPVTIQKYFVLKSITETYKCENLFPPWEQTIAPGCATAFYCEFDQNNWKNYHTIVIYDIEDNEYRFPSTDAMFQEQIDDIKKSMP